MKISGVFIQVLLVLRVTRRTGHPETEGSARLDGIGA